MALQFATIDIGSFELELSIYEINTKGKIKRLDNVSYGIALGSDTYERGVISYNLLNELCTYLNRYQEIINGYQIEPKNVYVFGTSAMREAKNRIVVEDQIRLRCGLKVNVLSNSEQRFLSYKALPIAMPQFNEIIEKESAIVDIGYGSMQLSLYNEKKLLMTQNLKLGALRIQANLDKMSATSQDYRMITEELVDHEIESFAGYFLGDKKLESIIAVGDCMRLFSVKILGFKGTSVIPAADYLKIYDIISRMRVPEIAASYDLPTSFARLVIPVAMIYYRILVATGAKNIYIPGTSLCDGVTADWAERKKLIRLEHDFTEDIISSAREINKRYQANSSHTEMLEKLVADLFEVTKKIHGMGRREKLLLSLAAILHDVGKYISMTAPGRCGYDIIMATEILGLSHDERNILAYVVKYNTVDLASYDIEGAWSEERYMTIYKLTAILRICNALDRSHKQKAKDVSISIKNDKLIIAVQTDENIALEKGLLEEKGRFFEEAFGLTPELHVKKRK